MGKDPRKYINFELPLKQNIFINSMSKVKNAFELLSDEDTKDETEFK